MDCRWLPQASRVLPFIHVRSVGNQTAYSEDDHVNSVAPGTSSGWEEPKRTKRNCNAIIRKTHENINEHHGKHGLPCRWWVLWVWHPLYTLFILMNSEFGVFEHVLVKTTELPCWLNEVCKAHSDHIVTLLNEKELHNTYWSNWKSTSLNICLKIVWKHSQKRSPEVSLGGIKTLAWSLVLLVQVGKARGQTTSRILGWNKLEDGQGLHYHELPQAPCASIAIGSCPQRCKPQRSKSCLQWGRQCWGKRTRSGCGRNQSGPRGTAMPSCGKPLKTFENHWKPWKSMPCPVRGRFCSRCKLCSNWGTLSSTCSSMSLSKLLSWSFWLNEVC